MSKVTVTIPDVVDERWQIDFFLDASAERCDSLLPRVSLRLVPRPWCDRTLCVDRHHPLIAEEKEKVFLLVTFTFTYLSSSVRPVLSRAVRASSCLSPVAGVEERKAERRNCEFPLVHKCGKQRSFPPSNKSLAYIFVWPEQSMLDRTEWPTYACSELGLRVNGLAQWPGTELPLLCEQAARWQLKPICLVITFLGWEYRSTPPCHSIS